MRIVEVCERGEQLFPRSDLIDSTGRSLVLESTRNLKVVEIRDVEEGCKLLALGSIGYLPLTPTITLNIVPKFPLRNLWTMLEIAGETYESILPVLRRYENSGDSAPSSLLLRSFCFHLKDALALGLFRGFSSKRREGFYRQKLDFGATMSRFLSRGDQLNVVANSTEFGLAGDANAVIKDACIQILRHLPTGASWEAERRIVRDALESLSFVKPRRPSITDFELAATVSLRLRTAYAGMLLTYKLLLTGGGVSFAYEKEGRELPSFLFNLETIFENFIRRTFQLALRQHHIRVTDGNKSPGSLFVNNKSYPTKSDLLFSCERGAIAVGEVKYKPKIKETDRYQIISHVIAANAKIGILFSPANLGEDQRLVSLGQVSTGAKFYHYLLSIDGDILKNAERMIQHVYPLLTVGEEIELTDEMA